MSRNRSQRKQDHRENQLDIFGRRDPFEEMHQVMRGFGGFGGRDDFFGGGLMKAFDDPMQHMMNFSDVHRNLHGSGKEGSYVCQSYVSSSTMGPDGKMKQQSFMQNSVGQNKNGQTISQKQQAYKNSDGVKRMAEERMLNDKGHKIMKEKKAGGEIEHSNHYYNMNEDEADRFGENWKSTNNEMKFLENHQKYMQSLTNGHGYAPQQRQLGYERRREEPARRHEEGSRQDHRPQGGSRGQRSSQQGSSYKGSTKGRQF